MAIFNSYVKLPDGNQVLSIFFRQQRTAIWHNLVNIWPLVTCFNSSPSKNHLASTQMYRTDCVPKQQPSIFSHGSWIAPSPLSSEQWTGQGAAARYLFGCQQQLFIYLRLLYKPPSALVRILILRWQVIGIHYHWNCHWTTKDIWKTGLLWTTGCCSNYQSLDLNSVGPQKGRLEHYHLPHQLSVGPGVLQSTAAPPASQLYQDGPD